MPSTSSNPPKRKKTAKKTSKSSKITPENAKKRLLGGILEVIPADVWHSRGVQFAVDVLTDHLYVGGIHLKSGVKRKQACERFLRELVQWQTDESYPWRFDLTLGERPIRFMENFLKPSKGAYSRMELLPWQCFIESNLYGWVSKTTGYRRFREAIVIIGQGNGKSTMIAGNGAYALSKDGERGAEVYALSNSKEQAKIVFGECAAQVTSSPILSKHIHVTNRAMYFHKTKSKFEPLASDSKNLAGRNVRMGIFDEIHEYRDYKLINVIKGKTKKRKQPLIIYITTLGSVIDGPLMDLYMLATNILGGSEAISQRAADRVFCYVDEIDENDQPDDVSCWGKANPSLGRLLDLQDLIDEWERVKTIPAERANFINKQLNVFTSLDELSFLSAQTIRKNNRHLELATLEGRICYGGFDLAETQDFTSACLEFPLSEREVFVLEHTWVPAQKVMDNHEKLDWDYLQKIGSLTVVDDVYVHYEDVLAWFLLMKDRYAIDTIGYDPAKSFGLVQEMQKSFTMNVVRQGELTLTAPLDDLGERFLDGCVIFNENPLFRWYLSNVKLKRRSDNATYLPTRQNKYRKIDGFAALLDAHTELLRQSSVRISPDHSVSHVIKLK